MNNSIRLRNLAPDNVVFVSESGIKNAGDIAILERNRVGAVLIGETLMRSPDKKAALENLNGGSACIKAKRKNRANKVTELTSSK